MLVLSRQINETIMIGDNIEITVVDVRGDKVRLGIVAPKNITVHRKEVYLAIQEENIKAAAADVDVLSDAASLLPGLLPEPPKGETGAAEPGPVKPKKK